MGWHVGGVVLCLLRGTIKGGSGSINHVRIGLIHFHDFGEAPNCVQ